ncbi:MAG: ArsC family transcriptional regulator [Psychroflexus sp.]|nr:ArsC family transcriptional regulator [Psychroflexus sp.]MDN6311185.1 ArsC family transcriptional regulator [Psychroflexus sp.]
MSTKNKGMGVLSQNKNLIKLYVHPENRMAKQSIAVAEASKAIKEVVNLSEVKLTETQWADLADLLKLKSPKELINFEHDIIKDKFGDETPNIEDNEALKLLTHNQDVLKHGIAVRGKKAVFITNVNDIMQLQESDTNDITIP